MYVCCSVLTLLLLYIDGVIVKRFYLLIYSIAVSTLLLSPLNM